MTRKIKWNNNNDKGRGKSSTFTTGFLKPRSWWTFTEERKEMIAPYINYYDSERISRQVRKEVMNEGENGYNPTKMVSKNTFLVKNADNLLPNHLIMDIYNMYYRKSVDHEYAILDDTNRGKWLLLESVNDSSLKIVTNQSTINSVIFTIEICRAILRGIHQTLNSEERAMVSALMNQVKAEQKEEEDDTQGSNNDNGGNTKEDSDKSDERDSKEGKDSQPGDGDSQPQSSSESGDSSGDSKPDQNSGDGDGNDSGDSQSTEGSQGSDNQSSSQQGYSTKFESLVRDIVYSGEFRRALSDAKREAFQKISKFEQTGMTTQELERTSGSQALEMISIMDSVRKEIEQINSNLPKLKNIIEKIVDKSTSYFSSKCKTYDLSIFESDTIDELDGVEYFHPKLKKTHLEEVITREHKYKGKLNVYIDISSSMNHDCNFGNTRIPKLLFAKALVIKMLELDLVDKVIPFGSNLKEPYDPPNIITISLMVANSGTNINLVVDDCEKRQENGIVVTDCEDRISRYSDKCFILGTSDARFNLIDEAKAFSNNNQLWSFNYSGAEIIEY